MKNLKKKDVTFLLTLLLLIVAQIPLVTAGNLLIRLSFDGTNDYVAVADSASLNFSGGDFSCEIWARVTNPQLGTPYMFVKADLDWTVWWSLEFSTTTERITFSIGTETPDVYAQVQYTFSDYDNGEWHHYAATWNNTDTMAILYVDGTYVGNDTETVGDFDSASVLSIGYDSLGELYPYRGELDEARIYSRVLTAAEITYSYNNIEPQDQTNLVMWLRMNEGEGTTTYDETANNNDGTISGATWIDEEYSIIDYTENASLVLATLFGLVAVVLGVMIVFRPMDITIKEVIGYLIIICVLMIFVTIFTSLGGG